MKGLKKVAEASAKHFAENNRWMPIYYSIEKDTVYATDGPGRDHVTDLIRENSPEDIKRAVIRWLWI